eukprot:3294270-Prymnesium_polylepis.1
MVRSAACTGGSGGCMKLLRRRYRVSRRVLRVACRWHAAHRALNEPRYWPDRMCGLVDCHVYFK